MAKRFGATVTIDRPIEVVFAFLVEGENDKKLSKAPIVVPEGDYDLAPAGQGTELSFFNELEAHGFGKVLIGLALRSARKGADDFVNSIKRAIEAS